MEFLATPEFWVETLLHGILCGIFCSLFHLLFEIIEEKKHGNHNH